MLLPKVLVVDAIKASGIAWTILRPTGFFNDMADYFNMAARGTAWVVGDGKARINPIHGADLADFAVEKIGAPLPAANRSTSAARTS